VIAKGPQNPLGSSRPVVAFTSARSALQAILAALETRGVVLLPSYIGWSAREGSGVFDPIRALNLDYSFYALDEHLRIDLDSLRSALLSFRVAVLVVIHYFGYVDPSYNEAVRVAREQGAFVLEDEAHAMFSDMIGGICGRLGDAGIYSFHKMLPVPRGGAAVLNDPQSPLVGKLCPDAGFASPLQDFDLYRIADQRRKNGQLLNRLIHEIAPDIRPLFGPPGPGEVPQTFPVIIPNGSRDALYHEMNAAGHGVVSLYHTLIDQISARQFSAAAHVSRHIMNLPVHQDATDADLESMVRELARRVGKC
jgi:dTDP-4-amino-4,6-dideoxygalactose transaminase